MELKLQKKLAGAVGKCSKKRVKLDPTRLEEIKEAITKNDVKRYIKEKIIKVEKKKGTSRVRARKIKVQKSKGRRKGQGSRKGKKTARAPKKEVWMNRIRKQRELLKSLKDKDLIGTKVYRSLYLKAKGGFFRSVRHIKLYLNEHNLFNKEK